MNGQTNRRRSARPDPEDAYELLDTKTGRVIRVRDPELYERYLSKDSGRYVKAG